MDKKGRFKPNQFAPCIGRGELIGTRVPPYVCCRAIGGGDGFGCGHGSYISH